ncbi:MAG: FmdB family zinc ribbon protein [Bryobacteraceae bacterium]
MPLYEYLCHRCGKNFEVLQKFADEPLVLHPECGGPVERLVSASAFKFKGSGWYVNDYGKGKTSVPDSKNGHDSKTESKPESKPDTKPEAKTAAKSESKPSPAAGVDK